MVCVSTLHIANSYGPFCTPYYEHEPIQTSDAAEGAVTAMSKQTKLRGLSPRANYTDRAAAAGRRS